jgi:hypothetical protein
VLNPTPASAHEGASFITRENPYLPTPRGSYGSSRSLFSVGLSVHCPMQVCINSVTAIWSEDHKVHHGTGCLMSITVMMYEVNLTGNIRYYRNWWKE